jgi:hypothetical protein
MMTEKPKTNVPAYASNKAMIAKNRNTLKPGLNHFTPSSQKQEGCLRRKQTKS